MKTLHGGEAGDAMFVIQSLGGVRIEDESGTAIRLRSRKHVALFLYLAAAGKRIYTRDSLARLLWDTPLERARHSLSQAVYDVRTHLPGTVGSATGDAVSLDPATFRLDSLEFEKALKAGDLSLAVDMYRGPFADNLSRTGTDEFQRWVEQERIRLARLGELSLRRYVRQCDETGRWGEMCVAALRLVKLSPLDEEAHRALMRGLWLHGDGASAIRHYEEAVLPLESEFPGGTSDETRLLVERIRATPAPEPWVDNLGELHTPFLGRGEEMEVLRASVRGISETRETAILVSGEAGIGKSRLVSEFTRSVGLESVRLIESRCFPAEADVPYGPVIDGLRPIAAELVATRAADLESFTRAGHLLPELEQFTVNGDQRIDPAAWRRRLYEEVTSLVRLSIEVTPVMWVIEDVQWMDATSQSLLHYMTRRLKGHPFLLIATLRVARGSDLPDSLPLSLPGDSGLTRELRLEPLSEEEIGELLSRASPEAGHKEAVQLAQRLAGGNPFFALEVFRAAAGSTEWAVEASRWDPLTDVRLSKVLAIRLKGLSQKGLRILQATAVLERQATPGAVAAVAGLTLPEAAEASIEPYGRGLLHDSGARLGFANDVVREYVYAGMTALARTAMHLTAAEFLARDSETNAATLARHFHLGEDKARTYVHSLQAAREAKASAGQMEAAAMADLAVKSSDGIDERLVALHLLAEAELESAQLPQAKEHLDEILRLDTTMAPEERVEVKLKLVEALAEAAEWAESRIEIDSVTHLLETLGIAKSRIEYRLELLNWRLKAATRVHDVATATRVRDRIDRLRTAAEKVRELSQLGRITALCSVAAFELFYGSAHRGLTVLSGLEIDTSWPDHLIQRIRMLRGLGYQRMGLWDASEHQLREAYALAIKTNDVLQIATVLTNLSCTSIERGDWDAAQEHAASAERLHEALTAALDVLIPLRLNEANLRFYRGEGREAANLYRSVYKLARESDYSEFNLEIEACLGLVALQLGDAGEAKHWRDTINANEELLSGIQERFKVEWFWAYCNRREDPAGVRDRLIRVAEHQASFDRVGSLKLEWLRSVIAPEENHARNRLRSSAREALREAGLGWFTHFSERWRRLADLCDL